MRYCIKSLKWKKKKKVFFLYCVIFLIAVRLFRLWKSAGSALRRQSRFWQTLTSTCWGCGAQWARFKLTCSTLMMLQITPGRWWRDTCKCENTEDFPLIPMNIIYLMLIERTGFQLEKVKNTTQIESHPSNRKLYHPNNAALGMAAMRAGVTHWQAGQIEVAHGMICKAYAILMVTHGPTHPITKDLDVSITLKLFKLGLLKLFNRNKIFLAHWVLMFLFWFLHRRCAFRQRWSWGCSNRMSMFITVWERQLWRTNPWPWCTSPSLWRRESKISSTGGSDHMTAIRRAPPCCLLLTAFRVLMLA